MHKKSVLSTLFAFWIICDSYTITLKWNTALRLKTENTFLILCQENQRQNNNSKTVKKSCRLLCHFCVVINYSTRCCTVDIWKMNPNHLDIYQALPKQFDWILTITKMSTNLRRAGNFFEACLFCVSALLTSWWITH